MPGKKPNEAARLRRDYGRLAARLSKLNFIAQGAITERTIMRPDPGHPTTRRAYGPYYQWTWKKEGKTVTVNLTAPQAKAFRKAIDEHRKLSTPYSTKCAPSHDSSFIAQPQASRNVNRVTKPICTLSQCHS
jgi:hypothetical protein